MTQEYRSNFLYVAVAIVLTCSTSISIAQSREEIKAAAAVEILVEQKAAQERAAIDRAKRDLMREADTSKPLFDPEGADTRFDIFLTLLGLTIVGIVGWKVSKVVRLVRAKAKLEAMTPSERKKFFQDNPGL